MKNFSNDPMENLAIKALPKKLPKYKQRAIKFNNATLYFYIDLKIWELVHHGGGNVKVRWGDVGEKEKIIKLLIEAKPELEREFLRAKSKETLTAPRALEAL